MLSAGDIAPTEEKTAKEVDNYNPEGLGQRWSKAEGRESTGNGHLNSAWGEIREGAGDT